MAVAHEALGELGQRVITLDRVVEAGRPEFRDRIRGDLPHHQAGQVVVWIQRKGLLEQPLPVRGITCLQLKH